MMLNCKEATRLMSQAQDRPLNLSEQAQLRFHLLLCKACTHFNRQLKVIRLAQRKPDPS